MTNAPPGAPTSDLQVSTQHLNEISTDWLAKELVQSLVALAEARGEDIRDFLAGRVIILSKMTAAATAENQILQAQVQALSTRNSELLVESAERHAHGGEQPDQVLQRFMPMMGDTPMPPQGMVMGDMPVHPPWEGMGGQPVPCGCPDCEERARQQAQAQAALDKPD